jgi:hypothetical protein
LQKLPPEMRSHCSIRGQIGHCKYFCRSLHTFRCL